MTPLKDSHVCVYRCPVVSHASVCIGVLCYHGEAYIYMPTVNEQGNTPQIGIDSSGAACSGSVARETQPNI